MKRAIIFWDYSNFQITIDDILRKEKGEAKRFDLAEFTKSLQGQDDIIKIYFACSKKYDDDELAGFYKDIDYNPFFYVKVFERSYNPQSKKNQEKQLDVYLATQMVALAYENAYDIAYLISGDEDFVPAVEIVQQKGKIVVAVAGSESMSKLLKRKADKNILIDNDQMPSHKPFHYGNFLK